MPIPASPTVANYTAVDDFGNIINPMIVEGQVHGGIVQGIGQALAEGCVYDKESGQLLTGSYMDYQMPRAADVPSFKLDFTCTPCPSNPLGMKGCGEAGAIASPAAVMNAVTDALGVTRRAHAGNAAGGLEDHAAHEEGCGIRSGGPKTWKTSTTIVPPRWQMPSRR